MKIKQILVTFAFNFIAKSHKKAEKRLTEMKKNKMHGSPEYVKQASLERKLREAKKKLKSKIPIQENK